MQRLMDNSIFIISALCVLSLGLINLNAYLGSTGYSLRYAIILLQRKLVRLTRPALKKLFAAGIITVIISLFVFRQVWNMDNFIVVVLTYVLAPVVAKVLAGFHDPV